MDTKTYNRTFKKLVPGVIVRQPILAPGFGNAKCTYRMFLGEDCWMRDDGTIRIGWTITEYYLDRIMGGWACFVEEEN